MRTHIIVQIALMTSALVLSVSSAVFHLVLLVPFALCALVVSWCLALNARDRMLEDAYEELASGISSKRFAVPPPPTDLWDGYSGIIERDTLRSPPMNDVDELYDIDVDFDEAANG